MIIEMDHHYSRAKRPSAVLSQRLSPQVVLFERGAQIGTHFTMGEIVLPYEPSKAFGDGSHPTTRLCAGAVDFLCRQRSPQAVLDVGTGTGVLARIARARGAQRVVATDIDPEALSAARANAALDPQSIEIELSDRSPDQWDLSFDLVIANILEGPLRELASALSQALRPGGVLLLSGFTSLQVPGLRIVFESKGLKYLSESTLEGWSLLMFEKV